MIASALPTPVASDAQTVTLRRTDWNAYVAAVEDAADIRAVQDHAAWVVTVGTAEARRLSYTDAEVGRMLDGVSAVTIWRERNSLSQRSLAALAEVSPSYLAEIEAKKKPGSVAAIRALSKALNVPMDVLVAD